MLDDKEKFAGIFTTWDIARECALDAKVARSMGWAYQKNLELKEQLNADDSSSDES